MKKSFALLVAFLVLLIPCISASAYPSSGSITVVMINKADKQPLESREVTAVKIADCSFSESDITFSLNSDFADTEVDLNEPDSAQILYSSVKSKDIDGITVKTDSDGKAVFSSCEIGAYLVYSPEDIFAPFVVLVPMVTDDGSCFEVVATPKIDLSEEPSTEPESETTTTEPVPATEPRTSSQSSSASSKEKLPQTGMLQYPVPLLGLCGVIMFSKGFVMYVNSKKEDN